MAEEDNVPEELKAQYRRLDALARYLEVSYYPEVDLKTDEYEVRVQDRARAAIYIKPLTCEMWLHSWDDYSPDAIERTYKKERLTSELEATWLAKFVRQYESQALKKAEQQIVNEEETARRAMILKRRESELSVYLAPEKTVVDRLLEDDLTE